MEVIENKGHNKNERTTEDKTIISEAIPTTRISQTSKEYSNECSKIKDLLHKFEVSKDKVHEISDLCNSYLITRRVLYDFITIMTAIKVVDKISNENFIWKGIKFYPIFIKSIKDEISTISHCDFKMFNCNDNDKLKNVTVKLLELFYYLGTEALDIRRVSILFINGTVKRKTMLRKLYTISNSLEVIGLIEKTDQPAIIKINISPIPLAGIELLLNHPIKMREEEIFVRRREKFNEITDE